MTVRTIDEIFRDFVTDGVPASGPFNPHKPDIRDTLKALTEGSENFPDNRVIRLNNADEGTANNIVVTASVAIPAAAYQVLYILNVTQENTGPVTVSGAINRTLVTNTSRSIEPGYLQPGMALLCIDTGTDLRLLSYGDAEAVAQAAEDAAERAEAAAAGLNLPVIQPGDAGKSLIVNDDEDGYELGSSTAGEYESRAKVEETNIPETASFLRTAGYYTAGDGGGALYKRVTAEPAHSAKVKSADGAWWELVRQAWPFEVFGAIGDGVTINDMAYLEALAFYGDFGEVTLTVGREYILSDNITNPSGIVFHGKGRLRYAGNVVQSYADRLPLHIGGEYLAAFASKQFDPIAGIALFGDSTVAQGNAETGASLRDIIRYEFDNYGIGTTVNVKNYGVGGTVIGDMDAIPKIGIDNNALFIIKYGINDGGMPLPTRLATFRDNLRTKLNQIRSTPGGDVASLSILLVSPSSAFDDPAGKNENWMEQLREIYVRAARDFKCAFFDAYAFAKDNRAGSGFNAWMIDSLHPNWASYEPLWCSIVAFISAHSLVAHNRRVNGVYSIADARRSVIGSVTPINLPNDFPFGISIHRALPSDGWPFDGSVITLKHVDGACLQTVYPFSPSNRPASISRVSGGSETAWSDWTGISYNPTMENGWGIYPGFAGMAYRHDGQGGVHLSGVSSAGATSTGTVICTVPAQFAPAETRIFAAACGGASGFCNVAVDNTGAIKVHEVEPSGWVSLDITWPVK